MVCSVVLRLVVFVCENRKANLDQARVYHDKVKAYMDSAHPDAYPHFLSS